MENGWIIKKLIKIHCDFNGFNGIQNYKLLYFIIIKLPIKYKIWHYRGPNEKYHLPSHTLSFFIIEEARLGSLLTLFQYNQFYDSSNSYLLQSECLYNFLLPFFIPTHNGHMVKFPNSNKARIRSTDISAQQWYFCFGAPSRVRWWKNKAG